MQYTQVTSPRWANAEQTAIDCTVTFTGLGVAPFTAGLTDSTPHGVEIFNRAVIGEFGAVAAYVPPPAPTPGQVQAAFTAAIQARLDNFARTRNYDGILSACSYVTSTVPAFAAEAAYCVSARDTTWAAGYAILGDVQAGQRAMPTLEQVLSELPALSWP